MKWILLPVISVGLLTTSSCTHKGGCDMKYECIGGKFSSCNQNSFHCRTIDGCPRYCFQVGQ